MKLNLKTLKQVLPDAEFFGLSGNEDIDIFNIAHLKEFESLPKRKGRERRRRKGERGSGTLFAYS